MVCIVSRDMIYFVEVYPNRKTIHAMQLNPIYVKNEYANAMQIIHMDIMTLRTKPSPLADQYQQGPTLPKSC